jgi:hypothetical protein
VTAVNGRKALAIVESYAADVIVLVDTQGLDRGPTDVCVSAP